MRPFRIHTGYSDRAGRAAKTDRHERTDGHFAPRGDVERPIAPASDIEIAGRSHERPHSRYSGFAGHARKHSDRHVGAGRHLPPVRDVEGSTAILSDIEIAGG